MKVFIKEKYLILSFFNKINKENIIDPRTVKKITTSWDNDIWLDWKKWWFWNDKRMIEWFLLWKNQNYEDLDEVILKIYFKENYSDIILRLIEEWYIEKNKNSMLNENNWRISLTKKWRWFLNSYKNIFYRYFEMYWKEYSNLYKIITSIILWIIIWMFWTLFTQYIQNKTENIIITPNK